MNYPVILYIAVMAVTTYLIRVIPFTVFTKKIRSRFVRSLLYYIPYAVLSAMTFPAIFYSTGEVLPAAIATAVALITAFCDLPMIIVALAAAASAFAAGLFL